MMMAMSGASCDMQQQLDIGWRCVIFHKQRTSARTRFLRIGRDVVLPEPIDDDCELGEPDYAMPVLTHPAAGLPTLARELGLPTAVLRVEGEPLASAGESAAPIWLVEVTSTDPPGEELREVGGRFVSIMEARDLPQVQRELLRMAYERILG